jgi:hypothetical protein
MAAAAGRKESEDQPPLKRPGPGKELGGGLGPPVSGIIHFLKGVSTLNLDGISSKKGAKIELIAVVV